MKGKIKWFSPKLGYGFIEPEDGSTDMFFHFSGIQTDGFKSVDKGDVVSYEVGNGPKGKQAEQVKVIEKSKEEKHGDRN